MDTNLLSLALDPTLPCLGLGAVGLVACAFKAASDAEPVSMAVTSPSFADGGMIPVRHTCDGRDVSPELQFSGVPAGAKSLAVHCHDTDSVHGDFTHWLAWNIPPGTRKLTEGVSLEYLHAIGAVPGANGWDKLTYGGPCPHSGTHRYVFAVYALRTALDLSPGADAARFLDEIRNKILAEGRLMGRYARI